MPKINYNKLKIIRSLIVTIVIMIILIWTFGKNEGISKLIISPFLICTIAKFGEFICLLFKKERWIRLFHIIFLVSFFSFIFGFLLYALIYSLKNQDYGLLLLTSFFFVITFSVLKRYKKISKKEKREK